MIRNKYIKKYYRGQRQMYTYINIIYKTIGYDRLPVSSLKTQKLLDSFKYKLYR